MGSWQSGRDTEFRTEKSPATGSRGMVVTNHPLASAAGAQMLAAGGNAIDAAVSALFTLTVVEACWRADGTAIGVSGGLARAGVRFLPEAGRPAP
jgi:Gamma-glutamyltranspeptidase